MQISITTDLLSQPLGVRLSDDKRALANFLSILDKDRVCALDIADWTEQRIPKALASFPNLMSIKLTRCHALQGIAPEFGKCPSLKSLAIIQCADFYDLSGIGSCRQLEVLHVSDCDGIESLEPELAQLSNLKALDLSYCRNLRFVDLRILPKELILLDIHGCSMAAFDQDAASGLHLVSTQIQDWSRILSGHQLDELDDMSAQLRLCIESRSFAGLDD